MKYIITEDQLDRIKDEILTIPYSVFNNNWDVLQKFLNKRGNPPYIINDDVNLYMIEDVKSLGSLIEVKGNLYLSYTSIESLGNLTFVGGYLDLRGTPIQSLGNLSYVGGYLGLRETPISKKYTEQQIRDMVEVGQDVYL